MNKVILLGRFTKDPDFHQNEVNKDSSFCRFTLAVDRPYNKNADGNQQKADFISCVAFNKTSEFINNHFHKGDPIIVEGRIQTGSYEKNGQRVYTTDIMVEKTEFVPRSNNDGEGQGNTYQGNASRSGNGRRSAKDNYADIPSGGGDEELPFN